MIDGLKLVPTSSTKSDVTSFKQPDLPCHAFEEATFQNNGIITSLSVSSEAFLLSLGHFPNLKELKLFADQNLVTNLKLFEMFPNLQKLEIRSLRLKNRSKYDLLLLFKNGETLKSLKMKVNSVDCIQKLAHCFPRLEELDLTGSSELYNIGSDLFSNFPNLKKLCLSDCSIRSIDPEAFNHLIKLDELDISDNSKLTKFYMKGPVLFRVLRAHSCDSLALVKLLDSNSVSSCAIEQLVLHSGSKVEKELRGPSCLFSEIRVLFITPTRGMSFDSFGSLEYLVLTISKIDCVKRGQLASLVCLKNLRLMCENRSDKGLLFNEYFFNCPLFWSSLNYGMNLRNHGTEFRKQNVFLRNFLNFYFQI
jgi:hypothetical protein